MAVTAPTRSPDNILLLDYLREKVGLTGTKTGCDGGECGACTVLIDDRPVLSCLTLAATVQGRRVDTIESLGTDGQLSAVQRGFHEKLGSQCGYCTPGFIMASAGLLRKNPQTERGGDHRSARQQYLPLHRLREDHRGGAIRRHAERARSGAVNEIVPGAQYRHLRADDRRPGESVRPRQIHRRHHRSPASWPGASIAAPIRMARSSRSMSRRR